MGDDTAKEAAKTLVSTNSKSSDPVVQQLPLETTEEQAADAQRAVIDAILLQSLRNPLPRAVRRGGEYRVLDGEWKFDLDSHNSGVQERWYQAHDYRETLDWPSSIESVMARAAHALITAPLSSESIPDRVVGWYEREFTVPPEWREDPHSIVLLTFGACGFETRVWLNGHSLRTVDLEEVHKGEFTSFSYELPDSLLEATNRLTVRTEDSLDPDIPRGKQESRVFKRGGIWYQTISGPTGSVWIEPVGKNRLRSRLSVISTVEDRLVEFVFTVRVRNSGEYKLHIDIATDPAPGSAPGKMPEGVEVAHSDVAFPVEPGEHQQRVVVELPGARLWGPGEANLYRLQATLHDPEGGQSLLITSFGLRKIEARGRWVYLNNERVYLDGILYQPGTARFEEIERHLASIQALGCNLTRVHIAGVDPRIYEVADRIGMMLWVEVPSPHASTGRSRDNHWAELRRLLSVIASHPSVCILSLYNEDWGVQDIAQNLQVREYVSRTFAYLRLHYPQLLVVDNDGWRHVSTEGRLESHLLTAHIYTPDVELWQEELDGLISGEHNSIMVDPWKHELVVGDPYFYRGQVPFVVSEWGGFGWSGYGGPGASQDKAGQIRRYKQEMRQRAVAGDIYTQATSIEDEVNGLIDPATGALLVSRGVLGPPM